VEFWSDEQVILQSIGSEKKMIIHSPLADILMTSVFLTNEPAEEPKEKPLPEIKQAIQTKMQEIASQSSDIEPELKALSVKQLRLLALEQDRRILRDKQKEHFGSSNAPKLIPYGDQVEAIAKGLGTK
jgi:hypothetical protein